MSLAITLEEFLDYTSGERAKWERWFGSQPAAALAAPVQRDGRFPTLWQLIDHIFLVERRHTQRLRNESPLIEKTGVSEPDGAGLFAFGRAARENLTTVLRSMTEAEAAAVREFNVQGKIYSLTSRKLAFHILMHEVRHWAQIATAVHNAGFPPPGEHDLFFSEAMR